ncbi:photosystem reaction center subunit H [Salinimicrobium flavum]|uniref:Photosystem reaction center subunit H n=1 Tax=Salinimicrobium flavum TaxID=1737065 RepID=A0ABW5J1D8_9FLAO
MKEKKKHLYYLNELSDYKVDSDDPDVRGWKVKDVDNRTIGHVDNLLVSPERKRVVYLDVEVEKSIIDANHDPYGKPASGDIHEFINKEGENHLIIPIGLARLNLDDKYVYTDRINHQTFAETKRMEKGYNIDRDYEVVVLESYNRDIDEDRKRDRGTRELEDVDNPKRMIDEDERRRGLNVRDEDEIESVRGEDRGTYDERRDRGRIPDDDSFYDRGEFDRDKYRSNR